MCHTISGLKCGIRRTPPPRFFKAQKTRGGGYISRGQVKYFSEISCLTPPKYSRVKGGDWYNMSHKNPAPRELRIGDAFPHIPIIFLLVSFTICHKMLHPKWVVGPQHLALKASIRQDRLIGLSQDPKVGQFSQEPQELLGWSSHGIPSLGSFQFKVSLQRLKIKSRSVAELYLNYIKSPSSNPTFNLCQVGGLN